MWKKQWEIGTRGKIWRTTKNMTCCARNAMILDWETSNFVDVLIGGGAGMSVIPNLLKVFKK